MEEEKSLWFEKLQERIWELEFLISGGAIFSLLELSQYFLDIAFTLKMTFALVGTSVFIIVGMFGIKVLTVGFATHLIVRAYWVGLISLHYIFPKGIRENRSSIQFPFKESFQINDNLEKQIIILNKIAGIIISLSISLTIIISGLLLSALLIITIPCKLLPENLFSIYDTFISIVFFLYLIDIFSFSLLRKIKLISYILFPFFLVLDNLSLRIFYSKALKIYNTNLNKRISLLIYVPFLLVSFILTYNSIYKILGWRNLLEEREYVFQLTDESKIIKYVHYIDLVKESGEKLSTIAIQSQIITEDFLKIYIPYRKNYDFLMKSSSNDIKEKYYSLVESISLNDSIVQNIDWHNYQTFENDQVGLLAIIDISNLQKGKNLLKVKIYNKNELNIPFWKE
ncbi:MAG: hypothetical protein OHK0038_04010 [Flammeovirgaceae bacterium]